MFDRPSNAGSWATYGGLKNRTGNSHVSHVFTSAPLAFSVPPYFDLAGDRLDKNDSKNLGS